jgi:hypothetical protein
MIRLKALHEVADVDVELLLQLRWGQEHAPHVALHDVFVYWCRLRRVSGHQK